MPAVLCVLCLAAGSCGDGRPPPAARADRDLQGRWRVDWTRTVTPLVDASRAAEASRAVGGMSGDIEMEFGADTLRVRMHGRDRHGRWAVTRREGAHWTIQNGNSNLVIVWLDDNAFRVQPGRESGTPGSGLIFSRKP